MPHPKQVKIYWNSHKRCFSIAQSKGPVQHSAGPFLLDDPVFKVSAKGRQWVLRNRKKTVHATIRGVLQHRYFELPPGAREVRYNPYENETFVLLCGTPIHQARTAYFVNNRVYIDGNQNL